MTTAFLKTRRLLIRKVIRLPLEDSGLAKSIIRMNNCWIDSQKQDRQRFFRREALIIVNKDNGNKILRYAMGHTGLSISKSTIGLDYDATDSLVINPKCSVNLVVRRAHFWEVWVWFWRHPMLDVRLSIRLGFAGGALGLLGFLTAIIPLVF